MGRGYPTVTSGPPSCTGRSRAVSAASTAQRFAHLRSYLSTTRKHDIPTIDALVCLFNGDPWMPPAAPAT